MEETKETEKEENIIYWDASKLFSMLQYNEFTKLVMPFIKAYYKHQYGGELYLHEHPSENVCIILTVDRNTSILTFYNEPNSDNNGLSSEIINDKNNLTHENIFDFIYYEYKQLFRYEDIGKLENKKLKITL